MKKIMLGLAAMVLVSIFNGCAITTKAVVTEGREVSFGQYQLVKIEIVDNVKTAYSKSGIEMFEGLLKQRIGTVLPYSEKGAFGEKLYKGLGKTIVDEHEDLLIKISIPYFQPDNKALRMVVGFGSGKGGLKYEATFERKNKIIAILNGGKSYGDIGSMVWEPDSTVYRGSDSTQILMASHSVNEIVEFIRSNGKKFQENQNGQVQYQERAPEKSITPTPTTFPLGTTKILTWDFSVVKSAPGSKYSSIATVRKGDKLTIMEQSGEWVRVRLENGQEGWIRTEVLE